MCYGGVKVGGRIKNAIIIEVPAIPHSLVWLNCRGQGYLNDVSIEASLSHYKGISRQCLCCRGCHRAQYDSEGCHHDILKPSILFHNLSCFYLVMFSFLVASHLIARDPLDGSQRVSCLLHRLNPDSHGQS
jgi:hypothetical protein